MADASTNSIFPQDHFTRSISELCVTGSSYKTFQQDAPTGKLKYERNKRTRLAK
jgi:hypothetical protein